MRVRIEKPCFIESTAPFTIVPIYEPTPKLDDFAKGVKKKTYPAKRKPMPKQNRTCAYCGRTFRGISRALYCSTVCKHSYYANDKQPMDAKQPRRVHVGAE